MFILIWQLLLPHAHQQHIEFIFKTVKIYSLEIAKSSSHVAPNSKPKIGNTQRLEQFDRNSCVAQN